MRFKLLKIIISLFFLMNSFAVYSDQIYKLATNCDDLANETFGKWAVEGELKNETIILNRTKRKDIIFETLNLSGRVMNYYTGINVKTKDASFPICFDPVTMPTIILIENRELYNPFDKQMNKHLYISFHSMINCGVPCTQSSVHSVSFYNKKSYFWDLTIRDSEYPSIWFMKYLTFKETYAYAKKNGYDDFNWGGKRYKVK